MNCRTPRTIALALALTIAVTARVGAASGTVLVLHSYHQGYEWTNAVNAGILSTFAGSGGYELAFEYLDSQRNPPSTFDAVEALLARRYGGQGLSAIIAVDDDALRFLIARRAALFPDTPIAFCGVNDISAYSPESLANMTGVTESPDIEGSLRLALRIFPAARTLFVIADTTTSGTVNLARFDKAASSLPSYVTVQKSVGEEMDTVARKLSALAPDAVVLYLSYLRTSDDKRLTVAESVSFVTGNSPAPVFGCWDFIVEAGAFGGRVVSGRLQGIGAAERALRIAGGARATGMPIADAHAYESFVRNDQLDRFKVRRSMLPDDVVILGAPAPLPRIIILGIMALIAIIALEAATIVVALGSKRLLAAAESRYRTLAEQIPAIVYSVELGKEARTSYVSPQLKEILGYEPKEWVTDPKKWVQAIHPDDRARLYDEARIANELGEPATFDYRAISASGEIKNIKNSRAYYLEKNGRRAAIGVWLDVTDERKTQESLRAALEEKELLLKEIHHRVKNNFQIVSSLLRLERERIPEGPANTALHETEGRIFAMALVHERLYQQGDLGHIDFKPYAERMGRELIAFTGGADAVSFSVRGDELSLGVDKAVPLGLFLNEALMNAFKHAFPSEIGRASCRERV